MPQIKPKATPKVASVNGPPKAGMTPATVLASNPLKLILKKKDGSEPAPKKEDRIVYPELEVYKCYLEGDAPPITQSRAKELLRWETESEYIARVTSKMTEAEKAKVNVKFKDWTLIDENGEKVKCWACDRNRPFTESWARSIGQEILNRRYAGPTTVPGETVNGETITISRTGRVESGQHRLIGFVLACQMWAGKNKAHWQSLWKTEPILETLLVTGISDSPKVVQTIDNTRPRSVSDSLYTSEILEELAPVEKRECARMLEKAIDFLWQRSGAGTGQDSFNKYQTNAESRAFLERHPKLLECVKHIFQENRNRAISLAKFSPGQCAGALYLMGSCKSDGDAYRNAEVRDESGLVWDTFKQAKLFWSLLVSTNDEALAQVRHALGSLVDEDSGTGGRTTERFCVVAKAWALYLEAPEAKITEDQVELEYVEKDDGTHLDEWPDFGGIDIGPKRKKSQASETTEAPTPETIAANKEAINAEKEAERKKRADEMAARIQARRKEGKPGYAKK